MKRDPESVEATVRGIIRRRLRDVPESFPLASSFAGELGGSPVDAALVALDCEAELNAELGEWGERMLYRGTVLDFTRALMLCD